MKRQRGRNNNRRHNNNNNHNNNPNRSMDSNGPDVKVRGSANTIYEKYIQLARDAKTAGNRVKAESYLQHAEHYLRLHRSLQPKVDPAAEAAKKAAAAEAEDKRDGQDVESASSTVEHKAKPQREPREKRPRRPRRDYDAPRDASVSNGEEVPEKPKKAKVKKQTPADETSSDDTPNGLDVIKPSAEKTPEVKPRRRAAVRKPAPKASAEAPAE